NLLTTILGHSEVAIGMLDEEHPVREDLTQIKRAGDMAAALTKQLLAFSRKQVIEPRIIEVAAPIARVAQLLKRLIKEDVKVTVDVPDGLGTVRVDPIQLEQAVLNLAINARDAMPSGGRLTIRAARTATPQALGGTVVLPAPPGDCIVVSVTDTGTGMDVATQSRIFEPFFTTKPAGRGTGLGLATVYGVVKQSGAGLSLISAPGEGSTFAIAFAVVQQVAPVKEADAAPLPPVRLGATILLVEDETGLREIAQKVLGREGFRVLPAADAEEALTLAASAPFPIDLLLTDVVMPGMNGPTLARVLTDERPALRVLLMSGYPGDDLSGELPADQRFLRKPFTPYILLEHVRAALTEPDGTAPIDR
ncbi:MAG: ATP-binding protein, partial [Gemmatimonadales bacterium]